LVEGFWLFFLSFFFWHARKSPKKAGLALPFVVPLITAAPALGEQKMKARARGMILGHFISHLVHHYLVWAGPQGQAAQLQRVREQW